MELLVEPLKRRLSFESGDTLLDVLRRNALPISCSCRAGRCGACACCIPRGRVQRRASAPASARNTEGHVLACQAVLTGDCAIELPEVDG